MGGIERARKSLTAQSTHHLGTSSHRKNFWIIKYMLLMLTCTHYASRLWKRLTRHPESVEVMLVEEPIIISIHISSFGFQPQWGWTCQFCRKQGTWVWNFSLFGETLLLGQGLWVIQLFAFEEILCCVYLFQLYGQRNHINPKTLLKPPEPSWSKRILDRPSRRWRSKLGAFVMSQQGPQLIDPRSPFHLTRFGLRNFANKLCTTRGTQSGPFVPLPKAEGICGDCWRMIFLEGWIRFLWDPILIWLIAYLCPTSQLQKTTNVDGGCCLFA